VENNRVVIDPNVFISAIIGRYSYPYKIFDELVLTGEIQPCFSNAYCIISGNTNDFNFSEYRGIKILTPT